MCGVGVSGSGACAKDNGQLSKKESSDSRTRILETSLGIIDAGLTGQQHEMGNRTAKQTDMGVYETRLELEAYVPFLMRIAGWVHCFARMCRCFASLKREFISYKPRRPSSRIRR